MNEIWINNRLGFQKKKSKNIRDEKDRHPSKIQSHRELISIHPYKHFPILIYQFSLRFESCFLQTHAKTFKSYYIYYLKLQRYFISTIRRTIFNNDHFIAETTNCNISICRYTFPPSLYQSYKYKEASFLVHYNYSSNTIIQQIRRK